MDMKRYSELRKISKHQLAQQHVINGGVMGLKAYLGWSKDELINAVIEDEEHGARKLGQ